MNYYICINISDVPSDKFFMHKMEKIIVSEFFFSKFSNCIFTGNYKEFEWQWYDSLYYNIFRASSTGIGNGIVRLQAN